MRSTVCEQCGSKMGLGIRYRRFWNGWWWQHVRFCSHYCEELYTLGTANIARRFLDGAV